MKELFLKRSLLVVSFICNNRCKLCGVESPYYEKPPHFSAEDLCRTITQYFKIVSHVDKFTLSGGEPLIHPEIVKIVSHLKMFSQQYNKLEIISNGKVLMSEDLEKELYRFKKAELLIDDYGINSKQCEKLASQARNIGISVNYRIYYGEEAHLGGWFDMGDYSKRNRSIEETNEIYQKCGATKREHFGLFIVKNEGHTCFRSWRTMDLGLVNREKNSDQYVDFWDDTEEKQVKIIESMQNREFSIAACEYCYGQILGQNMCQAGEQL